MWERSRQKNRDVLRFQGFCSFTHKKVLQPTTSLIYSNNLRTITRKNIHKTFPDHEHHLYHAPMHHRLMHVFMSKCQVSSTINFEVMLLFPRGFVNIFACGSSSLQQTDGSYLHCGIFLTKASDFSMPLRRIFLGPVKLHINLGHIS